MKIKFKFLNFLLCYSECAFKKKIKKIKKKIHYYRYKQTNRQEVRWQVEAFSSEQSQ